MRYALIIISFFTHALFAQTGFRTINMYTTQNGLSDNSIYCIRQDSRGFLWLGTKEGLNRFDGFRFKNFFAAKDPATGLANNTISDILEYQGGQLLIATSSGLSVFNTLTGNFENEKIANAELKAGSGTLIRSLYKDKTGNIWINHSGELDLLDSTLRYQYRFTDLSWAKDMKGIILRPDNWVMDRKNRLWLFADTSSIQLIDFSQKKIWNRQNNPQQYEFLNPTHIRSAYLDESANTLWYAPWGRGIYRYELTTNSQLQQNFGNIGTDENKSVNKIVKLNTGKFLCSNGSGCFMLDAVTLKYDPVPVESPDLTEHNIGLFPISLLRSANGNYWVGTYTGLFQLENEDVVSSRFDLIINGKKILPVEYIDILRSSSGDLYITSMNNVLIEAKKDLQNFAIHSVAGKKNISIVCMDEDLQGNLWIGSSQGFYYFNTTAKKFTQPHWLHPDLYHSLINAIYCDKELNIWIATRNPFGIYKYAPSTGGCEKINNTVTAHFEKFGVNSRVSYITEDDKHVWMISKLGGGIICYNKTAGDWSIYPKEEKNRNLLSKGLNYVHADSKNNLWISDVFGTGLIKYDYLHDSISMVTRNDGLPSDFILRISYDGSGNLWILTEYGMSRFDLQKEKIVLNSFFKSRLSYPIEFLTFDSTSKSLICATKNELLFYPVSTFQSEKKQALHPVIDKIWVNSKGINADVNGQSLKFKPGETNVSIDFTAVHYSNADKIRFAYLLSGADHDWKYTDVNRSAQYAVLTPGKYIFRIKVADENGNWNEPIDSFSFTIVPPFWQTTLFKILLLLTIAGSIFYFFRRRIKSIRHEAELKQKVAETEMMALRAQMNPHFIFNCINSIDALVQSNDKYNATVYLNKFAKLIRNILDSSKQNTVPLAKDLETLQYYIDLEQFRNENKFTSSIHTDESLLEEDFKVPPMIVQPYVENAIVHGLRNRMDNNGKLSISISRQNGHIQYIIEDNGVGRIARNNDFQNKKASYGMQMSKDRVKLFNNEEQASVEITDLESNGESAGTRVRVLLKT